MRIVYVASNLPRRCGIATFTADLIAATKKADSATQYQVAAIDEPNVIRPYENVVRWRIRQGSVESYRATARAINETNADIVNVQHEFGLYGVWRTEETENGSITIFEDHLTPFLKELTKPSIVTFHSVLPNPSPSVRDAVRSIVANTDGVVVMASTAIELLQSQYGVETPIHLIHHGMPEVTPTGRRRFKEKLGLQGRTLISTFGLVDPRKGLEYMIEAMRPIVNKHPDALYLIAGQTHPDLLQSQGEQYRNTLLQLVEDLGLEGHVGFVNQYITQRDIIDHLLASDVYVTPYLDPNQITSGTLSYALGAGKAIVSTPYLHAVEALGDGRGLLVDFRSADQLATAVISILDNPELKKELESASYAYAKEMTWPKAGVHFYELMADVLSTVRPNQKKNRHHGTDSETGLGHRLEGNPLITPADVRPSTPGFEVATTLNPGVATVGEETVLLVRVSERPIEEAPLPSDAMMMAFDGPGLQFSQLPKGLTTKDVVGVALYDVGQSPAVLRPIYVARDLPGLDLSDPRVVRHKATGGILSSSRDEVIEYLTQVSHIRVARSRDGINFTVDSHPALIPDNLLEEYGLEDPRVTFIDGKWYITYVGVSRHGVMVGLASTTDFQTFGRHGVIFLPDHKDVVIFPERVGGKYLALTRPMPQSFGGVHAMWVSFSEDLLHWGSHKLLVSPRAGMWDELRVGAGAPPIKTDQGWLEIYHGVDRNSFYCLGGLLLDLDDPTRVIARSPEPIFTPETQYEKVGLFANTVFACGATFLDEEKDMIRIYYGAADTTIAAADFSIRAILGQLEPC